MSAWLKELLLSAVLQFYVGVLSIVELNELCCAGAAAAQREKLAVHRHKTLEDILLSLICS
jgi:hypothetical protein